MKLRNLILLLLLFPHLALAEETTAQNIPLWHVVTDIPENAWLGLKTSFSKDALPAWAVIAGSTLILYNYDQDLNNGAQRTGRDWGLTQEVKYKSLINIGKLTVFSGPTDTAGFLYFLGDGVIPIGLSVGLVGTGYFSKNSRLYNTGVEMSTGLLTGSIFDQLIKHIAGRESPSAATRDRGRFRPFPNLKSYSQSTSKYDAFASGHIMTATVMFTVLEQEYPEYNMVMYPLEVVWLGVLGFGMMNVGVHWASDYPLGIAMGYVFGKTAVTMHHPERNKQVAQWRFFPGVDPGSGTTTMNALYRF